MKTPLDKTMFPVMFSLPVTEKLDLPPRAETLPRIKSGDIEHLDFTARVYGTGRNRNPYLFKEADLAGFADSFEGQPYLRNHDNADIDARDGTIMASRLDGGAFVQDIRLTTRRGMTDFVEGKMDRFSIGWFYDDIICTICNSSFFSSSCNHRPGEKYQTPEGEKTCMLLFINPQGRETSAVNSPAVVGTGVIDARLQEFKLSLLEGSTLAEELEEIASDMAEKFVNYSDKTTPASATHVADAADGGLTPPRLAVIEPVNDKDQQETTEVVTTSETSEVVTLEQTTSVDGQEAEKDRRPETGDREEPETEDGQKLQMAQVRQASHARQLELAEQFVFVSALHSADMANGGLLPPRHKGANIMNIRELMSQRAAKITRARELANLADTELRDFSDEERSEYQAALDEAQKLGEKVTQIQTEREALQNAELSLTGLASEPEKPAPSNVVKTMKRSEYDKLEALVQAAYIKAGGMITD